MNFLMLRSTQTAAPEQPSTPVFQAEASYVSKHNSTLEGLIAQDPFPVISTPAYFDGVEKDQGGTGAVTAMNSPTIAENHVDVSEDDGWIIIPYKELPDNWSDAPDILSFHSMDRLFLFPGEQVHILACLASDKHETEIITPFKVAAAMSKNGAGQSPEKQNGNSRRSPFSDREETGSEDMNSIDQLKEKISSPQKDVASGESLLRMEVQKKQTQNLLEKFKNSHFFVRIAESDEPLWSKRRSPKASQESSELGPEGGEFRKSLKKQIPKNVAIDRGSFNASASGGMARNSVQCCSLSNGDIVVLLQVNVGVDFVQDPILEIRQFEKYEERSLVPENQGSINNDPCGDLLKWLLPLDNSIPPPVRSLSPPQPGSGTSIRSASTKLNLAASFGHFRSYSMSSLPPNIATPPPVTSSPSARPDFDSGDWDRFPSKMTYGKNESGKSENLLSFRGVSLEPDRFSVSCGLEGIYLPGRRWRRKIEIVQPVEIHSFNADCNTEELLCVQIKNVSPAHLPDIVVYLDAITIVFEEVSKGGPPVSLPISCIESGTEHSLPNLPLRRGEEHSFILKPAASMRRTHKVQGEKSNNTLSSSASKLHIPSNIATHADKYAILLSCRCNYTESRLFFKQPTTWRPRLPRDLLISVASEMSRQTLQSSGRLRQLPVQVLTLQASNLTSEDLTITVFAPASFNSPPSVVSLNSSPTSPESPFVSLLSESATEAERLGGGSQDQTISLSDAGCTHLWLQSRVPLGCVPARSTATVKLELLPLTDGIVTLDSLQIDVKEKGVRYVPEHSLKINATSSIATGIM